MVKTDDLRLMALTGWWWWWWSPILLWTPVVVVVVVADIFFEINLLVVDGGDCCCCCPPLIKARSFNKPDTCGTLLGAKEIEPAIWLILCCYYILMTVLHTF
jgi:hypothetical protein